jgi:hypothetical protein
VPDDRGALEQLALGRRQAVQAGLQDASQRRRQAQAASRPGAACQRSPPARITPSSMSIWNELFDVIRVAFGLAHDQPADLGGQRLDLRQQRVNQCAALLAPSGTSAIDSAAGTPSAAPSPAGARTSAGRAAATMNSGSGAQAASSCRQASRDRRPPTADPRGRLPPARRPRAR